MNYITKKRLPRRTSPGRPTLQLIELALLLLVFAVCAAVCANVFAAASDASLESRELVWARSAVSDAAERYKSGSDISDTYYDKDFTECEQSSSVYSLYTSDGSHGGITVNAARNRDGARETFFSVEAVRTGASE